MLSVAVRDVNNSIYSLWLSRWTQHTPPKKWQILDISDLGDEGSKLSQNTGGYLTLKAVSYPRTVES